MQSYLAYFFLGVGVLLFAYTWFHRSRKSLPLMFAATMMIMGGLAMLQYLGNQPPAY